MYNFHMLVDCTALLILYDLLSLSQVHVTFSFRLLVEKLYRCVAIVTFYSTVFIIATSLSAVPALFCLYNNTVIISSSSWFILDMAQ